MKNASLLSTALTVLTTAPVAAQNFNERVVETLREQNFWTIEIDSGPTQSKFEAVRGSTKLEVVYDRATGRILKQETERFAGTVSADNPIDIDRRVRDFVDADGREIDDDDDDLEDDDLDDDDNDRGDDDDSDNRDDDDGDDRDDDDVDDDRNDDDGDDNDGDDDKNDD